MSVSCLYQQYHLCRKMAMSHEMKRLRLRFYPHFTHPQCSTNLDDPIQWSPDASTLRRDIANKLWEFDIHRMIMPFSSINLEEYFTYQLQQADLFMHDAGQHVLIRTHQQLIEIAEIIKGNLDRPLAKTQLKSKGYKHRAVDQECLLDTTLDLAVRLSLMIEIGAVPNGFSGHAPLQWTDGKLSAVLAQHFAERSNNTQEHVLLQRGFTARNIERIAGIRLKWTNNLADHHTSCIATCLRPERVLGMLCNLIRPIR